MARPSRYARTIPDSVGPTPILLLRASRDEASLAIGLSQVASKLLEIPFTILGYGVEASENSPKKPWDWLIARIRSITWGFPLLAVISFWLVKNPTTAVLPFWQSAVFLSFEVFNVFSASWLVFGYFLTVVAVGFWEPKAWLWSTVEVDASPEMQNCQIK